MPMAVLAGSGLSLTQAAKIAMEFHGIRTSGIALNDAVAALLKTKSKRSDRYKKDFRPQAREILRGFSGPESRGNIGQGDQRLAKKNVEKRSPTITIGKLSLICLVTPN
jgi:hypothetical protein